MSVTLMAGAAVLGAAMPFRARLLAWLRGLIEWEGDGGGRVVIGDRTTLATLGGIGVLGMCAYFVLGGVTSAGGGQDGPVGGVYAAPATPTGVVSVVVDTSTVWVQGSAFDGDGDDTQDSVNTQLFRVANNMSGAAMLDIKGGAFIRDTFVSNDSLKADTTYKARIRYKGLNGGWSAWSAPDTFVNQIAAADFVEDFEDYTNITNFLTDPNGWYGAGTETGSMSFAAGLNADGYALSRALRYTWPNVGAVCGGAGTTITMPLDFSDALGRNQAEVWYEVYIKTSASFDTEWGAGGCNADYKWLLTDFVGAGGPGPSGRFGVQMGVFGNEGLYLFPPDDDSGNTANTGAGTLWDGNWHKIRIHIKQSPPGKLMRVDVDNGALSAAITNISTTADSLYQVRLGSTFNEGPNVTGMTIDWGRFAIWTSDPGWGI